MSSLEVFPIALPGGINQSAPQPTENDFEELNNFSIFRARLAMRAPLKVIATLSGVDAILAVLEHEGKLWAIVWEETAEEVHLYSMNVDGTSPVNEDTVWTGVAAPPVVSAVSFTAGTASDSKSRIYISHYDQSKNSRYWDDDADAMADWTEDIDNDSSPETMKFSLLIPYKFHLWGTGFYEGANYRPEMLRFTQPGAIPGTDPAGGTNPKVLWSSDHRSLGRRGKKITALSVAGDRLIVFQARATNAIYGSGSDTWTKQELSNVTGCVGPRGAISVDKRLTYFWASDGPYRTDGVRLQYIGGGIRQIITEVDAGENDIVLGYSPDDGLVYFMVSPGGENSYEKALIFDDRNERWLTTTWLTGSAASMQIGAFGTASAGLGVGPSGIPTSLLATAIDHTQIDLAWTNTDTNINTGTKVYRHIESSFTASDSTNLIHVAGSGVSTYSDVGLNSVTPYYYQVKHTRNNLLSAASNEPSARTFCTPPVFTSILGITGGNRIAGTTNEDGANVRIEKIVDGSFAVVTTLSTPGTSFTYDETGITCGEKFTYRARTEKSLETNSDFTDELEQVACKAVTLPIAPTLLVATAAGTSQINLAWRDNADNETGFHVHRGLTTATIEPLVGGEVAVLAGTGTSGSFSDTGLTAGTTYHYTIEVKNSAGSSFSNTDSAGTAPS